MILNVRGIQILIDDEDFEKIKGASISFVKSHSKTLYARIYKSGWKGKKCQLHRYLIDAKPGTLVDHINMDTLDCRKSNLRLSTPSQNRMNTRKCSRNKSGYKGVSLHYSGKWQATIEKDGKSHYLGLYLSPELAYDVYCEASKKYHLGFGRTE